MGAFDYRQATEIRDAFAHHKVAYLFIGKSGAILLEFPDTTQDADVFVEKLPENGGDWPMRFKASVLISRMNNDRILKEERTSSSLKMVPLTSM